VKIVTGRLPDIAVKNVLKSHINESVVHQRIAQLQKELFVYDG
jgi:hypothetical protein